MIGIDTKACFTIVASLNIHKMESSAYILLPVIRPLRLMIK